MHFAPTSHITQHWQLAKPAASGRRGVVVSQCRNASEAGVAVLAVTTKLAMLPPKLLEKPALTATTGEPLGWTRTPNHSPGPSAIGLNGSGVNAPVDRFTEKALSVPLPSLIT